LAFLLSFEVLQDHPERLVLPLLDFFSFRLILKKMCLWKNKNAILVVQSSLDQIHLLF
ncbi:hypothetical protein Tco_0515926, partial [Tanacetum coccineum]